MHIELKTGEKLAFTLKNGSFPIQFVEKIKSAPNRGFN